MAIIKNYHQETLLFTRRVIISGIAILLLTLLLVFRLAYLQLVEHRRYTTLSQQNQQTLIPIPPKRGLIYDRNGILLAENLPSFSLDIIPDRVPDLTQTLTDLKLLFNIDQESIDLFKKRKHQHRSFEPISLLLKLSDKEMAQFYVNQHRFPGVQINARMLRHYPLNDDMASVLGYVGRINENDLRHIDQTNYSASNYIGKVGIERYYEEQLHGQVGYDKVEINATGQIVRTLKHYQPIPGDDLTLTIDSQLQQVAHKALGKERGSVIAIIPDTGEILTLVSHPSYDPNHFVNGINQHDYKRLKNSPDKPLYNRAIRGTYPLASTIKPFLSLQGLNLHVITNKTKIVDHGIFQLPNVDHIYRDWNWKRHGHGIVNLRKAIIVSCDIFFYELAIKLGIDQIDDILDQFGFGQVTDIDLQEELPGVLASPQWKKRTQGARWYTGDTVISGIGQGFMAATPLQLAVATATLANHGSRYKPHLLKKVSKSNGVNILQQPSPVLPVVLEDSDYWSMVIDAMQGVVHSTHPSGTGYRFGRNPGYLVAAKTGTAQIYRPTKYADFPNNKIPKRYRSHSLFIAFAPKKHPRIAIAVVVENAPFAPTVARKVMDAYLKKKDNPHAS